MKLSLPILLLVLTFMQSGLAQEVRSLTTPYSRANESLPLVIEFEQAPGEFEFMLSGNLKYSISSAATRHELAAFIPSNSDSIQIETKGQSSQHSLPPRIVPRSKTQKLVGIFSNSPIQISSLLGEKISSDGISGNTKPTVFLCYPRAQDFPKNWSMLSAFDAIAISQPQQVSLSEQQLQAIEGYLTSGGKMLVFGRSLFAGSSPRNDLYLKLGTPINETQHDSTAMVHYRLGAGSLIHIHLELESATNPAQLFTTALDFSGTRALLPSLSINQRSLLASKAYGQDFARLSVDHRKKPTLIALGVLLSVLAFGSFVSASFKQRRKALSLVITSLASLVLCAFVLTTSQSKLASHHRSLLTGPDHHAGLSTSIISTDPQGQSLSFELQDKAWVTPLMSSQGSFRFEYKRDTWKVHLTPGSSIRCDIPFSRLPFSIKESPLFTLDGGTATAETLEGETFYRDLASKLNLERGAKAHLNEWLEHSVWKSRRWQVWKIDNDSLDDTLKPLFDGPEPSLEKVLLTEYSIH